MDQDCRACWFSMITSGNLLELNIIRSAILRTNGRNW